MTVYAVWAGEQVSFGLPALVEMSNSMVEEAESQIDSAVSAAKSMSPVSTGSLRASIHWDSSGERNPKKGADGRFLPAWEYWQADIYAGGDPVDSVSPGPSRYVDYAEKVLSANPFIEEAIEAHIEFIWDF